jgi:hypothetical protein
VPDQFGTIYVDDLAIVQAQDLSVSAPIAGDLPTEFVLHQNYPNPFNPDDHDSFRGTAGRVR